MTVVILHLGEERRLFECGDYSSAASDRANTVIVCNLPMHTGHDSAVYEVRRRDTTLCC